MLLVLFIFCRSPRFLILKSRRWVCCFSLMLISVDAATVNSLDVTCISSLLCFYSLDSVLAKGEELKVLLETLSKLRFKSLSITSIDS